MSLLSIFVLLCCTVVCDSSQTFSGDSCKKFQLNKEYFNKRFRGPGLYEMNAPGHHDCVRNCFYLFPCKSTDYNRKDKMCKLNDVDSSQITASDFEQQNGAIFSDITAWPPAMAGKCGSRPCSKRQRCIPDKDTYHCADIYCNDLPTVNNGAAALDKINGNLYMDTATVTCEKGYLKSVDTVECTASGNWEHATCDPVVCNNLPTINNGAVVLDKINGNLHMDTATVTCDYGYLKSVDTVQCTALGDWEHATCDAVECGNPDSLPNGKIVLNSGTTYQNTASVICDAGYKGSVDIISCTALGSWDTVTCDQIFCNDLPTINNGDVALDKIDGNLYMDTATVTCNYGYLKSVGTVQCTGSGEWEHATCEPVVCNNLPTISNGAVVLDKINGNLHMDTATVTCDNGYLKSVDTVQCTVSGDWEHATCDPIDCGNPDSLPNGNIVLHTSTTYQNTASVTCDVGYQGNFDIISCTVSGSWDPVTCDPIQDCYVDTVRNYFGTKNITKTGYACKRWDDYSGTYGIDAQYIPESSLSEIENYCRNPKSNIFPLWCFSTNPFEVSEYCDIPKC